MVLGACGFLFPSLEFEVAPTSLTDHGGEVHAVWASGDCEDHRHAPPRADVPPHFRDGPHAGRKKGDGAGTKMRLCVWAVCAFILPCLSAQAVRYACTRTVPR